MKNFFNYQNKNFAIDLDCNIKNSGLLIPLNNYLMENLIDKDDPNPYRLKIYAEFLLSHPNGVVDNKYSAYIHSLINEIEKVYKTKEFSPMDEEDIYDIESILDDLGELQDISLKAENHIMIDKSLYKFIKFI